MRPDALTGRSRAWTFDYEWPRLVAGTFDGHALDIDVIRQDADNLEQLGDDPLPTLHFGEAVFEVESSPDPLRWLLH